MSSTYYTTTSTTDLADFGAIMGMFSAMMIPMIIVAVVMIIAEWKIFTKAGEAGWKCLIPIYNMVVLFKIIGLSPWLILLYLLSWVPFLGWIVIAVLAILQAVKLGQAFGKSTGFIVGLIFLGPIFQLMLAFGSAEYVGPQTKQA